MRTLSSPKSNFLRLCYVAVGLASLGNQFCLAKLPKVRGESGGQGFKSTKKEKGLEAKPLRRKRLAIRIDSRGPDKLTVEETFMETEARSWVTLGSVRKRQLCLRLRNLK
jgi:hypothetical protein